MLFQLPSQCGMVNIIYVIETLGKKKERKSDNQYNSAVISFERGGV